jgi:Na+/melibiose symporter-like transporter
MYMTLGIVAGAVTLFGNLMCGLFCKERIELPKKEKVKISKTLFTLFKYKNYRAYQYMAWVNNFAVLGKMSTLLAAITVGSSKNLLLTLPTAVGTVVGNLITTKLSKKYEPTKLLKFCGPYSLVSAGILFAICFAEAKMGIMFFSGWNSIFFYVFYFLFGVGIGVQELSKSHFDVEYFDYLEWQTGDRIEAIQGVVPGWINTAINYAREMIIPFMIAWVGYESSSEGNLVATMQAKPDYLNTCLWILGFLLFGYTLSNVLKAIILKTMYNIEGDTKEKMYKDLETMREKRRQENAEIEAQSN